MKTVLKAAFLLILLAGGGPLAAAPSGFQIVFNGQPPGAAEKGEDFVTRPDGRNYQGVVEMEVYKNGAAFSPAASVTWEIEAARIDRLAVGADGVWKREPGALNGLAWLNSASDSVDGTWDWEARPVQGEPPAPESRATKAYLADIVGSRTVTVKVTVDAEPPVAAAFAFGDGPLSVFGKVGAEAAQPREGVWARKARGVKAEGQIFGEAEIFQTLDRTSARDFPLIAGFCGGTVNNAMIALDEASEAGFKPLGAGWSTTYETRIPKFPVAARYATGSRLPTAEQLLAVAGLHLQPGSLASQFLDNDIKNLSVNNINRAFDFSESDNSCGQMV